MHFCLYIVIFLFKFETIETIKHTTDDSECSLDPDILSWIERVEKLSWLNY